MYIFDCYFFLSINLIHIKHRAWHFCCEIIIIAQHVLLPLKCLTARLSFELYLCSLFIHSFIHLFIFFFSYYLFVSLYLIYINQVWHFCLKSFNNSPACIYFHSSASPQDWVLNCIYVYLFIHSFTYSYFFLLLLFVHLI